MRQKTGGGSRKGIPNKSTLEIKELLDSTVDFSVVISKLFELVNGIEVQERRGKEEVIYSQPPDTAAAKILLEYRYGKPHQAIDVTTGGESISPKIIIKNV